MGDKMHSVEGTPEPLFLASARSFDAGGLWPGNNRGGPGGREPPRDEPRGPKRKKEKPREVKIL